MTFTFMFKGISSADMGISVMETPPIHKARRRLTYSNVDGRWGSVSYSEGVEAYDLNIDVVLESEDRAQEVLGWLKGEGKLVRSDLPNLYLNAIIIDTVSFKYKANHGKGILYEATIPFKILDPFYYEETDWKGLVPGEEESVVNNVKRESQYLGFGWEKDADVVVYERAPYGALQGEPRNYMTIRGMQGQQDLATDYLTFKHFDGIQSLVYDNESLSGKLFDRSATYYMGFTAELVATPEERDDYIKTYSTGFMIQVPDAPEPMINILADSSVGELREVGDTIEYHTTFKMPQMPDNVELFARTNIYKKGSNNPKSDEVRFSNIRLYRLPVSGSIDSEVWRPAWEDLPNNDKVAGGVYLYKQNATLADPISYYYESNYIPDNGEEVITKIDIYNRNFHGLKVSDAYGNYDYIQGNMLKSFEFRGVSDGVTKPRITIASGTSSESITFIGANPYIGEVPPVIENTGTYESLPLIRLRKQNDIKAEFMIGELRLVYTFPYGEDVAYIDCKNKKVLSEDGGRRDVLFQDLAYPTLPVGKTQVVSDCDTLIDFKDHTRYR